MVEATAFRVRLPVTMTLTLTPGDDGTSWAPVQTIEFEPTGRTTIDGLEVWAPTQ